MRFKWALGIFPFFLGLFFFQKQPFSLSDSYRGQDISVILQAVPKEDKQRLEIFFREMIERELFGYVLLGEKPVAMGVLTRKVNPFACFWETTTGNELLPQVYERFLAHFTVATSLHR